MDVREIKNPKFLKNMKKKDLEYLAYDIRKFIVDSVSLTGGHLSSNLGIVDLTIAIHKVFHSPDDKIIFDVGHQAYTHKILTGRAKEFSTLRKHHGLSGFQKRKESVHDVYEAGHSSTSLSAALGFALARDMNRKKNHVVAVIGDGSIGNGLAYEALNHIGSLPTKLIVILNDNEMSISKNVGALHNTLDKIRSNYNYNRAKEDTKSFLGNIPLIGKGVSSAVQNVKESLKKLYMKEGYLFEEFGFTYYGPINGHDYHEMLDYLEIAKKANRPVLLHVITEKGKGYSYAENDVVGKWHGVSSFDKETGTVLKKKTDAISWSEVIAKQLIDLATFDKDIVAITPAMANGAKLNSFCSKFPKRFIDVGIAEEHALVLANALSLSSKKPFVSIYSTFLQRGYDEVSQDIARMDGHVVLGIDRAGIVGEDGETHQGIYDVAYLSHIPNMILCQPKDSIESAQLLYTGFSCSHPFAIRYSRNTLVYQEGEYQKVPIGSWDYLEEGRDAIIITYGDFISSAYRIRETISEFDIGIVNARFIKPFDEVCFTKLLQQNKPIFIYEEVAKIGSLGQMLLSFANDLGIRASIYCYAICDVFVEQGTREEVLKDLGLDVDSMVLNIRKDMKTWNS